MRCSKSVEGGLGFAKLEGDSWKIRGRCVIPALTSPLTPVFVSLKALSSLARSNEPNLVVSIAFFVLNEKTEQSDTQDKLFSLGLTAKSVTIDNFVISLIENERFVTVYGPLALIQSYLKEKEVITGKPKSNAPLLKHKRAYSLDLEV